MNRLSTKERAQIIRCLAEGNSIRATVIGFANAKLLMELREICGANQDMALQGLATTRIKADEIWSLVYAKARNVPQPRRGEFGYDLWTWTALDADSKLMVSCLVSERSLDAGVIYFTQGRARMSACATGTLGTGHRERPMMPPVGLVSVARS